MALTTDIVASYRRPRQVLRRLIGDRREARLLVYLMIGCALIFVAQWPRVAREAAIDPTIGQDERLGGALFAWVFIAPLVFYFLSFLLSLILRIAGPVDAFVLRLGVFWAVLGAAPWMLLYGLAVGMLGEGAQSTILGIPAMIAFVGLLVAGLRVALERPASGA